MFLVCTEGNITYNIGESFVRGDCLENCTCENGEGFGYIPPCKRLCVANLIPKCQKGYQIETYLEPLNGTSCSCNRSRCVKRK